MKFPFHNVTKVGEGSFCLFDKRGVMGWAGVAEGSVGGFGCFLCTSTAGVQESTLLTPVLWQPVVPPAPLLASGTQNVMGYSHPYPHTSLQGDRKETGERDSFGRVI